ncbi:MAG TPA: hypothetical protein P5571_14205 [Candidatus Krumholzibacteria bacterium]|nr:hypothetical protein [Candidatus Krumholzibacteria bacterium]
MTTRRACLLLVLAALLLPAPATATWSRSFAPPGVDGEVSKMCGWNGGLVVTGWFDEAGGEAAEWIAYWTGDRWVSWDGGLTASSEPHFVVPYGTSVLVGGHHYDGIDKWDGQENRWIAMDGFGGMPSSCTIGTDGTIYLGGYFFTDVPSLPVTPLEQWTGGGWHSVYDSTWEIDDQHVYDIEYYWGRIYVGGQFENAFAVFPDTSRGVFGHVTDTGDHEWYGQGVRGAATCLEQGDLGVWVGGDFTQADGQPSNGLAWLGTGGGWVQVQDPTSERRIIDMDHFGGTLRVIEMTGQYPQDFRVRSYSNGWYDWHGGVFDDPLFCIGDDGTDLYVGGQMPTGVARWDDDEWVLLGGGIGNRNQGSYTIRGLAAWDDGVVACGTFDLPAIMDGQYACEDVAFWDGDAWHRMAGGLPSGQAECVAVFQGDVYVGLQSQQRLARWTGDAWEAVGGLNGGVYAMTVHGDELIVGGTFTEAGGLTVNRIAAYDGTGWRALGGGADNSVYSLHSTGAGLVAGGRFTSLDGVDALRVARWDGAAWHALGDGLDASVNALGTYDGELIAGGVFTASGATALGGVAAWDGAAWRPLGAGLGGAGVIYGVNALLGTSSGLFAGGDFTTMDGAEAKGLAVWDGAAWSEFEGGVTRPDVTTPRVYDLQAVDGDLWLAGSFLTAGDRSSCNIARWTDGTIVGNEPAPDDDRAELPAAPRLLGASPNPFNPTVRLAFELDQPARARLTVHDLSGRLVAVLADEALAVGPHARLWRGLDRDGGEAPSGAYVARLWVDGRSSAVKIMLLR